ncbi:MAG: ATP-dependent Clp protease ATP-binding subunit ClpC [bacterium]
MRLARAAVAAAQPTDSLRAIAGLREQLDALEIKHVDAALAAACSWRVIAEALGVSRQAAHRKHAARQTVVAKQLEAQSVAGSRLVIVGPARAAVVLARQEAAALKSRIVGTEHLLVGLVRERKGAAATTLENLGVTLEKVRHCAQATADRAHGDPETEDLTPPGWAAAARLPFSRRGRTALEQSLREAVRLGDEHLGVEHLLLALLRDSGSRAVQCLERLEVAPVMVEDELARVRAQTPIS